MLLLALVWRFWPRAAPQQEPAVAPAPSASRAPSRPRAQDPAPAAPTAAPTQPDAPIIDDVILEKQSVCEGEENLVTVKAHTAGGRDDAFLHYMTGSAPGMSVPVRLSRPDPNEPPPPPRTVTVFGRNNVSTQVEVPSYEVRDCKPARKLLIHYRLSPNTMGVFDFGARIIDVAAKKPLEKPVRFEWTFGDGSRETTREPWVSHDFGKRPQETFFSQFLISCEAFAADGETLLGRSALQLMNPAFEALQLKGTVQLFFTLTPRFPVLGADGVVEQGVHIFHSRPDPVRITRLVVQEHVMGGGAGPRAEEVDASSRLGAREIPPSGLDVKVKLDTQAKPNVFSVDYLIEGRSSEGHPVSGSFSVMRPPPKPTREASTPVYDRAMEARIKRAIQVLGKDTVTDEEIWDLERHGEFADLPPLQKNARADWAPDPSRTRRSP